MLLNKIKKSNIIDWSAIFVIILYLVSFIILNFKGQYIYYDSDMYADTLVAKYMWNSKNIFPNGWVFGNQCFVIGTPVIASLIYGICKNMFLSISIATTIVTIVIIVLFVWMLKPFCSYRTITIGLLILLASAIGCEIGKQIEGQLFYISVSYYSSYMITLLLVSGCFARIVEGIKTSKVLIVLSLLFSMACGMQSLRQTALMVLPLIICCFIFRKKECFIYTILISIFNVIGIGVIKLFGPTFNTIYGSTSISSPENILDKIINGFDAVKKISGLRWLLKGNIVGLFGLLLLMIAIVIVFIAVINKNYRVCHGKTICIYYRGARLRIATKFSTFFFWFFNWCLLGYFCCALIINISSIVELFINFLSFQFLHILARIKFYFINTCCSLGR